MIQNKLNIKCEVCGSPAVIEITATDWEDTPAGFTITRECEGRCPKTYMAVTPEEMHKLTGRPLSGWAS